MLRTLVSKIFFVHRRLFPLAIKTACVFTLSLFPQAYILERLRRSDIVIMLSDEKVDYRSRVNRCGIRTAFDRIWHMEIPVKNPGMPADETLVDNSRIVNELNWQEKMLSDVSRAYARLKHVEVVQRLVTTCFKDVHDDWLVNYLLSSFYASLKLIGWHDKEIYRGGTLQRRRYKGESEFLLNLALEAEADRLYIGHRQLRNLNQKLFMTNQIELCVQDWDGSQQFNSIDSVLDLVARFGPDAIDGLFANAKS